MKLTPLMLALVPALLAGQTQAAPTELGKGEGQLNIVAWAGYVERGETDKNYDWVTGFEKETGCKVNVKTAATSDEMVALMNEGGLRSGDRLWRCQSASDCRWQGAGAQSGTHPELQQD